MKKHNKKINEMMTSPKRLTSSIGELLRGRPMISSLSKSLRMSDFLSQSGDKGIFNGYEKL